MTSMVPVRKGKSTQVSLAELQERLDARQQIAETRDVVSSRKGRVEEAKRAFAVDPEATLGEIQRRARKLANTVDIDITLDSVPLSKDQVNRLSDEYYQLEKLEVEIEALKTRYKALTFAHLDETVQPVPGRPVAQVPGKMAAEGPGPHYVFERRGGNRTDPDLDAVGLREALPAEIVSQVYLTVNHPAIAAWDEEVFDESRFGELVESGVIDLDVVAPFLTPGKWRTPSFYKTLVED